MSRLSSRLRFISFSACSMLLASATTLFAQGPTAQADFNRDGFDDLAIGVVGHGSGGVVGAGAVHIIYGSSSGLNAATDRFFSQNTGDIPGSMENNDNCGAALATGDFNGDGFTDLAIGCPGEALSSVSRAGAVLILYGRTGGLSDIGSQFFSQNSTSVPDAGEVDDRCGTALAAGDFNRDGRADLAWGCPGEKFGSFTEFAGAINVVYGSANGLSGSGSQFIHQNIPEIPDDGEGGRAEGDDRCGQALTAADFNGDGRSDLAIGCPGEDLALFGIAQDAGAIVVLFGSSTGLTGQGSDFLSESVREAGDQCGASLAAGDFDGNGRADLAAGCPRDDIGFALDAGMIDIWFTIFDFPGLRFSTRETSEGGDRCGSALTTGDFDNDGRADLAWACVGENDSAGLVEVLHGRSDQTFERNQIWSQNSLGVIDVSESGDQFGQALATGDFDADGFFDLAIGVPGEDVDSQSDAGALSVFYGSDVGLTATGDQFFNENTAGIGGASESQDRFGFALGGSGGVSGPGLTGRWTELTQTCRETVPRTDCALRGAFDVVNPSTQSTPDVVLRFFLSSDAILDAGDIVLGELHVGALTAGDTRARQLHVKFPPGVDARGAFVIALVDAENVVTETDEANNIVVFGPLP